MKGRNYYVSKHYGLIENISRAVDRQGICSRCTRLYSDAV